MNQANGRWICSCSSSLTRFLSVCPGVRRLWRITGSRLEGLPAAGKPRAGAAASPLSTEDTGYHRVTLPLCGCARKREMNPKFRRSVLCSLPDTALLRRAHAALAQEEGCPPPVKKVMRKRQFRREAPCGSHQSQTSLLLQDAVTVPANVSGLGTALAPQRMPVGRTAARRCPQLSLPPSGCSDSGPRFCDNPTGGS